MAIPINKLAGLTIRNQRRSLWFRATTSQSTEARFVSVSTTSAWPPMATATPMLTRSAISPTTDRHTTAATPRTVLRTTGATEQDIAVYRPASSAAEFFLTFRGSAASSGSNPESRRRRRTLAAAPRLRESRSAKATSFVLRTGHHRRRLELGAWDNSPPPVGRGKAGLHVDAIPWMHERRIAGFLPRWGR